MVPLRANLCKMPPTEDLILLGMSSNLNNNMNRGQCITVGMMYLGKHAEATSGASIPAGYSASSAILMRSAQLRRRFQRCPRPLEPKVLKKYTLEEGYVSLLPRA